MMRHGFKTVGVFLTFACVVLTIGLIIWEVARPRPSSAALTIVVGDCGGNWDGSPYDDGYGDMLRGLPENLGRQSSIQITLDDILTYDYERHLFRLTGATGRSLLNLVAAVDGLTSTTQPQRCYLGFVNDQPRFAGVLAGTIDDPSALDAPHIGVLSIWEDQGWFYGQIEPYDAPLTDGLFTLNTLRSWAKTPEAPIAPDADAPYGTNVYTLVLPDSPELYQVLSDSGKLTSSVWP